MTVILTGDQPDTTCAIDVHDEYVGAEDLLLAAGALINAVIEEGSAPPVIVERLKAAMSHLFAINEISKMHRESDETCN